MSKARNQKVSESVVLRDVRVEAQQIGKPDHRMVLFVVPGGYSDRTCVGVAFWEGGTDDVDSTPTILTFVGPPGGISDDSDDVCSLALSAVCMRPGDTDAEYFAEYTADELDWAGSSECEFLSVIPYDAELAGNEDPESQLAWDDGELVYETGYFSEGSEARLVFPDWDSNRELGVAS